MQDEERFTWDDTTAESKPAEEQAAQPPAESPTPAAETSPEAAEPDTRKWFIIHTYSGFEQKVAESLRSRAEAFGFADKVGQILIPTEEVVELRGGRKVTSKRMIYPGYVLVQLDMDDD